MSERELELSKNRKTNVDSSYIHIILLGNAWDLGSNNQDPLPLETCHVTQIWAQGGAGFKAEESLQNMIRIHERSSIFAHNGTIRTIIQTGLILLKYGWNLKISSCSFFEKNPYSMLD